jgi:Zn finger protein HypA/HybF involved in hydrogenase expression
MLSAQDYGGPMAQATLAQIFQDVPSLHERRCWDCHEIHWHADNITPYVLCPDCKSQDTRPVRRREP